MNEIQVADRVSIIVPVYNAAPYLKRCLESIKAQTYECWVAIFVNDGSTDDSLVILQDYAAVDQRIRIINKSNGGPSSARNAGLNALDTDFFAFVDADDSIHPQFIERTLDAMLQHKCDMVVTGLMFMGKECPMGISGLVTQNASQYVKYVHGGPWAKLYRRGVEHRFCEDMSFMEDYVFTLSYAARLDKYYVVPDALYLYHYDAPNSLMKRFGRREMALEQYMYCMQAPWRVFCALKLTPYVMNWGYTLYNEFWKYYFFSRQFLNEEDRKKLTAHFRQLHKDFTAYLGVFSRLCAWQRWPRIYRTLRSIWHMLKKSMKY